MYYNPWVLAKLSSQKHIYWWVVFFPANASLFFCTSERKTCQSANFSLQSGMKQWKVSERPSLSETCFLKKKENRDGRTSGLTWAGWRESIQTGSGTAKRFGGGGVQEIPSRDDEHSCGVVPSAQSSKPPCTVIQSQNSLWVSEITCGWTSVGGVKMAVLCRDSQPVSRLVSS